MLSPWAWAATGTPSCVNAAAVSGFLSRSVTMQSTSTPRSRRASAAVEAATTTTSALRAISTSSLRHGAAPAIATVSPRQSPSRSSGERRRDIGRDVASAFVGGCSVEAEVGEDRLVDGFKDLEIHS